jgi:hypothetical protein
MSLSQSTISPAKAICSSMAYLQPKLTYPLPCCSLTQQQCWDIQAPALEALLPKLHLNQHTPRAILFGSALYGCLSLPELYTDQSFGQLKLLVGHLKFQDNNGSLSIGNQSIYNSTQAQVKLCSFYSMTGMLIGLPTPGSCQYGNMHPKLVFKST